MFSLQETPVSSAMFLPPPLPTEMHVIPDVNLVKITLYGNIPDPKTNLNPKLSST